MSPMIQSLRHYNTPVIEGIVHPSSNTGYQLDRLPNHQYHHRDRHGFGHPSEPAASNRGSRDHNRRGHVRRSQELTPVQSWVASQGGGSGTNIPGASFPIWSTL